MPPTVGRSSYLKFSGHDQNEIRFLAKIIMQIGPIQAPDEVRLFFETLESLFFILSLPFAVGKCWQRRLHPCLRV